MKDPSTLNDKELRLTIMDFLTSIEPENKKQKQRLGLYKRRLERIGFDIQEEDDHFIAIASDMFIAKLMSD